MTRQNLSLGMCWKLFVSHLKLASNFCFGILTNLTQIKHPHCTTQTKAMSTSYLSTVNMAHGDHC